MEEFEGKLKRSGLTGNEAKLYIELLRCGSLSAHELAKGIGMDRTLAYTVLNNLAEKGLVSHVVNQGRKYFRASSPENLLNPIRAQEMFVQDLIPELRSIEKVAKTNYSVDVYEGKEGLRAMFYLALKEEEFLSFGATGRGFIALYESPRIAKEAEKSKMKVRVIGNARHKGTPPFSLKFEFRYLRAESDATTSIFGDYVAIHTLTQKPLIILIKSKEIAKGYRNYFEVLWKAAEK